MKKTWWNKQIVGFFLGLLVPVVTSFLIYHFRYKGAGDYLFFLKQLFVLDSLGKLLSLSVIPNLIFFYVAIKKDWFAGARGVLMATMLFALTAVILFLKS